MSGVDCRDIFNAVYSYVKESYISNLFTSKIKSKTSSKNVNEDENLQKSKNDELNSETQVNSRDTSGTDSETVSESIERTDESKVADKIRLDIEEKLPFALASVCSNLATIDKEYRVSRGYDEQPNFSEYIIEIYDEFPLCDRFVFPSVMYVSSIILMDVDEKRSDDYYDKYATSVSQIISELPSRQLKTIEKYPY